MTGRTHDLAAFTALTIYLSYAPIPPMTLGTALVAFSANMVGGLLPDIDEATSDIWDKVRGGSIIGKIVKPLIGSHRMFSHCLIGMAIIAYLAKLVLKLLGTFIIVDMDIVWWSLMLGYISHLVMDTFTKEGVPWLLPIPIRFGFPPIKYFRVRTGHAIEQLIVFPGLLLLNGYLLYQHYGLVLGFLKSLGK